MSLVKFVVSEVRSETSPAHSYTSGGISAYRGCRFRHGFHTKGRKWEVNVGLWLKHRMEKLIKLWRLIHTVDVRLTEKAQHAEPSDCMWCGPPTSQRSSHIHPSCCTIEKVPTISEGAAFLAKRWKIISQQHMAVWSVRGKTNQEVFTETVGKFLVTHSFVILVGVGKLQM